MKNIIHYFLAQYSQDDNEQRNRAIFLIYGLLITSITVILAIPILLLLDNPIITFASLFSLLLGSFTLLYFKRSQDFDNTVLLFGLNGNIFFYSVVLITNGILSPFLPWLVIFPSIAIFLGSRNLLIINTLLPSILIIGSTLFHPFISQLNLLPDEWRAIMTVISLLSVGSFFTFTVLDYHRNTKKYNEQLKASNKELERFAYIASHDMKEPLRNITSFAQLLERRAKTKLNESELEYLDFIKNNALQMNHLVQDILEFSQIDKPDGENTHIDLNEVIQEALFHLNVIIKEKKGIVEYSELPSIAANEVQVGQLFQNLIENGLKYNTSPTPTVEIKVEEEDKNYLFYFKDNGIGISKEYHDMIFEMFKRLHNRNEYQGTGIGLALCKKIALRYNGDLMVHQSSEKGTTFLLILPKP